MSWEAADLSFSSVLSVCDGQDGTPQSVSCSSIYLEADTNLVKRSRKKEHEITFFSTSLLGVFAVGSEVISRLSEGCCISLSCSSFSTIVSICNVPKL